MTVYIDQNGSDMATGSFVAPFKRIARLQHSSDLVTQISGQTRSRLENPPAGTVLSGHGGQGHCVASVDVSEDAVHEVDVNLTYFQSGSGWALHDGANIESGNQAFGTACLHMPSGARVRESLWAEIVGGYFRLVFGYRTAGAIGWRVKNKNTNNWYGNSGAWGADLTYKSVVGNGLWQEHTTDWIPKEQGLDIVESYDIDLAPVGVDEVRMQLFAAEVRTTWSHYGGRTYRFLVNSANSPRTVWGCSQTAWSLQGSDALVVLKEGSHQDTLNTAEWFFDVVTGWFYFNLPVGVDLADVHLEYRYHTYAASLNADCSLDSLIISGGLHGVVAAGSAVVRIDNCLVHKHHQEVVAANDTASIYLTKSKIRDALGTEADHAKGLFSSGSNSFIHAEGCVVDNIGDDAVQTFNGGSLTLRGCSIFTPVYSVGSCVSVHNQDATGSLLVDNCTLVHRGTIGFPAINEVVSNAAGTILEVRDTAILCYGAQWVFNRQGIITIQNSSGNLWTEGATVDAPFDATGSELLGGNDAFKMRDPEFGDTRLLSDSPLVGAGSVFWTSTEPRPMSSGDEPYPDSNVDLGGAQGYY